jgi:hypothetical protein
MKALLMVLISFMLGVLSLISQPVKNDERPLPIVSAQAALASNPKKSAKVDVKSTPNAKRTTKVTSKKPAVDSGVKKKIAGLIM